MVKPRYYIGIDPGVVTGFALWDSKEKKFLTVCSYSILAAMFAVKMCFGAWSDDIVVRVEDARLRKWVPWQKDEKAERGRREGAGSVKRDAQIWEEFLKSRKCNFQFAYEMVAPKNNRTKYKADQFKKVTGWTGKTNEHGRDAAMLVFGK
jgi:hypothetical protein